MIAEPRRAVRVELSRDSLFVRARVVDVETGAMLAESDLFASEADARVDARLMICDNEDEVTG